jgi:hypothetical protein
MVFSEAEVQQHKREYQQYAKHQQAVDVLNEELDCAGDVFISCEGCNTAMDMVKLMGENKG